jgi:hypothetical protein
MVYKDKKERKLFVRTMVFSACLVLGISFMPGCVYEKEDILYPPSTCDTTGVTYSQTIVPILSANCYSCHSTANSPSMGSGIVLDSHHELVHHVDDGDLVGVINHAPGFPPMPKNSAKLSDCDIKKIEAWVNAGAPEN